jgi:hypothetical protein
MNGPPEIKGGGTDFGSFRVETLVRVQFIEGDGIETESKQSID